MAKENFLKAAKIIIIAWLVFMIIEAVAFFIAASSLTEESGVYVNYVKEFMEAADKDIVNIEDLKSLSVFKEGEINGKILVTVIRFAVLIPWYLSIKSIKENRKKQFSFMFLMMISSLVLATTYTTLSNWPRPETEGLQTWVTYLARLMNYPVSIATLVWSIWWLNSKTRIETLKKTTTVIEEKIKFKPM